MKVRFVPYNHCYELNGWNHDPTVRFRCTNVINGLKESMDIGILDDGEKCDIAIVQYHLSDSSLNRCRKAKKIVYDTNDYVFGDSTYVDENITKNTRRLLKDINIVTCSSPRFYKDSLLSDKKIYYTPDLLDKESYDVDIAYYNFPINIAWIGLPCNVPFLVKAINIIGNVSTINKVKLITSTRFGGLHESILSTIPIEIVPWTERYCYGGMYDCQLGIAPLVGGKEEWCEHKSFNKPLTYMYTGMPCIAPGYVDSYKEIVHPDLLVNNDNEWPEKVALIFEGGKWKDYSDHSLYIRDKYSIKNILNMWKETIIKIYND